MQKNPAWSWLTDPGLWADVRWSWPDSVSSAVLWFSYGHRMWAGTDLKWCTLPYDGWTPPPPLKTIIYSPGSGALPSQQPELFSSVQFQIQARQYTPHFLFSAQCSNCACMRVPRLTRDKAGPSLPLLRFSVIKLTCISQTRAHTCRPCRWCAFSLGWLTVPHTTFKSCHM